MDEKRGGPKLARVMTKGDSFGPLNKSQKQSVSVELGQRPVSLYLALHFFCPFFPYILSFSIIKITNSETANFNIS